MSELEQLMIQQLTQVPTLLIVYGFWRLEIKPLVEQYGARLDHLRDELRAMQHGLEGLTDCQRCGLRRLAEDVITDKLV